MTPLIFSHSLMLHHFEALNCFKCFLVEVENHNLNILQTDKGQ